MSLKQQRHSSKHPTNQVADRNSNATWYSWDIIFNASQTQEQWRILRDWLFITVKRQTFFRKGFRQQDKRSLFVSEHRWHNDSGCSVSCKWSSTLTNQWAAVFGCTTQWKWGFRDSSLNWAQCTDLIITTAMEITWLITSQGNSCIRQFTLLQITNQSLRWRILRNEWLMVSKTSVPLMCFGFCSCNRQKWCQILSLHVLSWKEWQTPTGVSFFYWQASCLSLIWM